MSCPVGKIFWDSPHFHSFHQNLPMLQLTMWRLSSDSPVRPASLLQWLDNLPSFEGGPHAWIIRLDGVPMESGAGNLVIDRPHPFSKLLNFWDFFYQDCFPSSTLGFGWGSEISLGSVIWAPCEASFWTSPGRPCPSGYGYGQRVFRTPSPVILCVIPGWGFGLTLLIRSSVLRRSLPPILCLVLSLFRLSDFAANLPGWVQCPVRAIQFLRKAARSASYVPSRLFVSPRNPERAMSKNAISFSLRQLITDGGAVSSSRPPGAHDVRGIATSLNYYSTLSFPPYANCYVEVNPCLSF